MRLFLFVFAMSVGLVSADMVQGPDVAAPAGGGREYYVAAEDPRADDDNDGSRTSPWKTLCHAAEVIQPGDTVWIRGGVYRETVRVDKSGEGPERMLSFRAMPGEQVTVKGSEVLRGWERCADEPQRALWETAWPYEGLYPSMVAMDDQPLTPLSVPAATEDLKPPKQYCQFFLGFGRGRAEMRPGSFFYDEERRKLLVWLKGDENPNDHVMETAVRFCWDSRGNYILVEGIRFLYSPLVVPFGGVAFVMTGPGGGGSPAEGCVVRGCEVALSAFEGMVVRGGKRVSTLVEDCWVHHNGNGCGSFEGLGDSDSDSWVIVRRCRLTDNNLFNWNPSWHAGGKHIGTRMLFEECEFARNYNSPGLWFDCKTRDCIVNRCYSHDNGQFGLYYEIGETGAFISNIVEGSPHCCAIALSGSSRSLVANNLVIASERGIIVGGESDVDGQTARITCHNSVYNNIVVGHGSPLITLSPEKTIACGNRSDSNVLWQFGLEDPAAAALFEDGYGGEVLTLKAWQERRGLDKASRVVDPGLDLWNLRMRGLPGAVLLGGKRLDTALLGDAFAIKPMPPVEIDSVSASISDHRPATRIFMAKVAELLEVPAGEDMPFGPLPERGQPPWRNVPLKNPSFETPVLDDNATSLSVPGWEEIEPGTEGARAWNCQNTGLWNWYIPDGNNVLILQNVGTEAAKVGVSQTIGEELQPNTEYELSVWAGQRIDQAGLPWPRVTVALYAGNQLLKAIEVPEPQIAPHHGVWIRQVVRYVSPPDTPREGPLRIAFQLQRCGRTAAQACFDLVALRARPATSEP